MWTRKTAPCLLRQVIATCSIAAAIGQTAYSQVPAAAKDFVDKVFTKCPGEPNILYFGPVKHMAVDCNLSTGARVDDCRIVLEFKDPDFVIPRGTPADTANGRFSLGLRFSVSRSRLISDGNWGRWSEYKDMPPTGPLDVGEFVKGSGPSAVTIGKDLQPMGALTLISGDGVVTVEQMQQEKASCSDIHNLQPRVVPPSAVIQRPASDGFRSLNAIPDADRLYTGSAEGFAKAFHEMMQRAATVSGLNIRNYDKEINFIIAAIRTCGTISPQMAPSIKFSDFSALGSQYAACRALTDVSSTLGGSGFNPAIQRGILLYITPLAGGWRAGQGFIAAIAFSPHADDGASYDPATHRIKLLGNYMIMKATIPYVASAGPSGPSVSGDATQRPPGVPGSAAETYYSRGQALLGQATVDMQSGKLTLPPECVKNLQKYLELAPNGPHAQQARNTLISGGIAVPPH